MTFKRKKGTLIKAVIAIPIIYFSIVGLLVTISGRGIPEVINDDLSAHKRDLLHADHGAAAAAPVDKWDEVFHNPEQRRTMPPQRDPLIPPVDQHVENDDHIARQIQLNDRKRHELRRQQEEQRHSAYGAGAILKPDLSANDPNVFHVTHPPNYNAKAPGM